MFEPDLFLSLSFFTYFLFSLLHPAVNLVWHTQRSGKQSAVSRPIGFLLLPQSFHSTHTHTHTHKRTHKNLRMITQSHISTVNLALFAPTTAHDSPCQFGLRPRRKPFPVVPGWADAARPGVLCSHSLGRGGASWAEHESPRLLSAGPPLDFVTLWPHITAPPPCMHLLNTAATYSWLPRSESWLTELQTPLTPTPSLWL